MAPVLRELCADGEVGTQWFGVSVAWVAGEKRTVSKGHGTLTEGSGHTEDALLEQGFDTISEYYPDFSIDRSTYSNHMSAKRLRRTSLVGSTRAYHHDLISIGCIVQALVASGSEMDHAIAPGQGYPRLFAVIGILQRSDEEESRAVTLRCEKLRDNRLAIRHNIQFRALQVLKLTRGVRRISIYHDYGHYPQGRCPVLNEAIVHTVTLFEKGVYLYQTRRDGSTVPSGR